MSIEESFEKLKSYCEINHFKGWDPYDGLNSIIFQRLPFINQNRLFRLAWIQLFKRNPINLRLLFKVGKDYNAKALGLFLTGYCNLHKISKEKESFNKIESLIENVLKLQSKGWSGSCWGYNFDWQARAFFQPKYAPTVVVTSFVTDALLEAHKIINDNRLLNTARSSCDFLLNDLNKIDYSKNSYGLSYSPYDKTSVFNASLLGARLLSRVYSITKEKDLITEAKKIVKYCCNYQQKDGSWTYGTSSFHQWIDNFHTGYNLECLYDYQKYSGDNSFNNNISRGLKYYLETFFLKDGTPKYYSDKVYPIDIHSSTQLVITICKMDLFIEYGMLVDKTLNWTIDHMQHQHGFFYYQLKRTISSKIPYMRWSQAWMFLAFSYYLKVKYYEQ